MVYPEVPLPGVILLPLVFIFLILFTDIRYNFKPEFHVSNGTAFASLVVAFILLYAMQKFDNIDLNVPTLNRSVMYLKAVALDHDPNLVPYLISYCKGFLCLEPENFALQCFEEKLIPLITNQGEKERVRSTVTILENLYNQRVSLTNTIAQPIWYLVFATGIILSIIFPMEESLGKIDAILVLLLIWLPITFIYALYLSEIQALEIIVEDTIKELKVCTRSLDAFCRKYYRKYKCRPNPDKKKSCDC